MFDFKAEKLEKPGFVGYIQKLKTSKMGISRTKEGAAIKAHKNIGGGFNTFALPKKYFWRWVGKSSRWLGKSSTMC